MSLAGDGAHRIWSVLAPIMPKRADSGRFASMLGMTLLVVATLLGAALQSLAGFGFALVLAPAALSVLAPDEAVTTLLVLGVALNALVLFTERREREILGCELRVLMLWALPGVAAGAVVLDLVGREELQVAVGFLVIAAVLARGFVRPEREGPQRRDGALRVGTGLSTGVLTTTTGTSGPPLVLWFEHLGASAHETRDTLAASFLILGFLGVAALLVPGGAGFELDPVHVVVLLACTLIGQVLGREVFFRLDPGAFRRIGFVLVLLTGVASIVAGLAG